MFSIFMIVLKLPNIEITWASIALNGWAEKTKFSHLAHDFSMEDFISICKQNSGHQFILNDYKS